MLAYSLSTHIPGLTLPEEQSKGVGGPQANQDDRKSLGLGVSKMGIFDRV